MRRARIPRVTTHVEKRELAKKQICPPSTVAEMLDCTPPSEIGTGHDKLVGGRATRLPDVPFGKLGCGRPRPGPGPQEGSSGRGEVAMPEPAKADVPVREGGTVLF